MVKTGRSQNGEVADTGLEVTFCVLLVVPALWLVISGWLEKERKATHANTHMNVGIHACAYTCLQAYTHLLTRTYTQTHQQHQHTRTHTHAEEKTHARTHTHTHPNNIKSKKIKSCVKLWWQNSTSWTLAMNDWVIIYNAHKELHARMCMHTVPGVGHTFSSMHIIKSTELSMRTHLHAHIQTCTRSCRVRTSWKKKLHATVKEVCLESRPEGMSGVCRVLSNR